MSASSFERTPVTRSMVFISGVWSIVNTFLRKRDLFYLSLKPEITDKLQMWRIFTSPFVFYTPGELVLGLILLYTLRIFERQFGSKKFAGALFFFWLCTTGLELLFLIGSPYHGIKYVSGGPYAFIFGLLVHFWTDIPQSTPFKVFGVPLSDKSFIYVLAIQLAFASFPHSVITSAFGILAGLLHHSEWLPFRHIRVPNILARCCERVFTPLLGGTVTTPSQGHLLGSGSGAGAGQEYRYAPIGGQDPWDAHDGGDGGVAMQPTVTINESHLNQLVSMGFDAGIARAALQTSGNDLQGATSLLLAQQQR